MVCVIFSSRRYQRRLCTNNRLALRRSCCRCLPPYSTSKVQGAPENRSGAPYSPRFFLLPVPVHHRHIQGGMPLFPRPRASRYRQNEWFYQGTGISFYHFIVDTIASGNNQDIGKNDGGVDIQLVYRLDGHFRCQFQSFHQFFEAGQFLTHCTVLRQNFVRMPHQPYRRAFHRLATGDT